MFASLLNEEQIARIHAASLEILERVGVVVPHPQALELLAENGASVEPASERVRIPPDLAMRSLEQAGKRFTLAGRDLTRTASFGIGQRNYNSIAGEALWVDVPGAERRYCSLEDVATAARLGDALDGINITGAMADPQDIPVAYRCVEVFAALLRATTKPVAFWFHDRSSAAYLIEMMVALRGSESEAAERPFTYPLLEPISPLRFPFHGLDLLFETCRLPLPVAIGPMAQMGLSAPATIAGTMAQENAEILAGLCIVQAIRPGTPVCYGGICHAFDMRTTQLIFAGPEQALLGVGMTQMGRHYGLPVYINVGLTDSKRPDAQAGLEAGITLMLGAAAGADVFGHLGISGVDQATSLDMLVLQEEVARYVESVMRPLDISDSALAVDEISDAGPGGSFIDRDHTARHFRKELWFPRILDREFYQPWLESGSESTEDRCRKRKEHLRRTHSPIPLPDDQSRELDRIIASARRNLG